MFEDYSLFEKVEVLQNILIDRATGNYPEEEEYKTLRRELLSNPEIKDLLPPFLKTSRNLNQFWGFIKPKFETYKERRKFLWDSFQPVLDKLEKFPESPAEQTISNKLSAFDEDYIHTLWQRALKRKSEDPEGAITLARTLLEGVCKHILEALKIDYSNNSTLPNLYNDTANALNLAPSQHSEKIFKQILGGCYSIVGGLGALRNKIGDAHGQGRNGVKPSGRHAELAVNLAGTVSVFLHETWKNTIE
ncbi:MAG: abortive infection family protein [Candidatus Marinimicrobia bacterium]|nr:abortive infection family protein [Candidatus Neomarinimicrobiota bacterium]MCF7880195.1 abortive infection family protein [Candidatus Neomarinimicrobiota bacterium]